MTESDPGREQRLANVLLTLADTMVTDFDIADLFHDLVHGCVDLLDVSAAGLMLVDTHDNCEQWPPPANSPGCWS